MTKEPRHHHFLSQCYLKGFTIDGTKTSKLVCLDLQDCRDFQTIPRNVGGERDFNRIEIQGVAPNALESKLGEFETIVDRAIRKVEETGKFEGEERIIILNLIALFAVRNPARREQWDSTQSSLIKIIMSIAASEPVGAIVNGIEITEAFKESYREHEQDIEYYVPRNKHIELEFDGMDVVLRCLLQRKWMLIQAPADINFLTCDYPIALLWANPDQQGARPPGHAIKGTQVYFSLSKKFALVGDFEGEDITFKGSQQLVAGINSNILQFARQQVYLPKRDFYFQQPDGRVYYGLEAFWMQMTEKNEDQFQ